MAVEAFTKAETEMLKRSLAAINDRLTVLERETPAAAHKTDAAELGSPSSQGGVQAESGFLGKPRSPLGLLTEGDLPD